LPLTKSDWIVTTLATWEANRALLHGLKELASTSRIAGVVRDETHEQMLRATGVIHIINPFRDAADHAAQMITNELNLPEDT
jgi:Trk K+ transport system NAD-binding subunit